MKRLLTALLFFSALSLFAQDDDKCYPDQNSRSLVYDESNILSDSEENRLNSKLSQFAKESSNQIVIVIVDDLCGAEPQQYATGLGHEWGVGQAKFDNGVVVLVKPSGGPGNRRTFIAVGYGLEGAIPDITAKSIVDRELLPNFKQGRFYYGLDQATKVLMDLAIGEYNHEVYAKQKGGKFIFLLPFLFFALIFFGARFFQTRQYAAANDLTFWAAFWLLSQSTRSHSGYYNSHSRHNHFGGGGGGFGGGGFGGFGGGGFGGGGAGGSW